MNISGLRLTDPHQRQQCHAFTVVELMITLSVLAVLFALGLPSIDQSIRNNRVSAQNNELMAILYYARSEAIRRNGNVTVILSANTNGWDAVVEDPDHEAVVEGCLPGQLRCASNTKVAFEQESMTLVFNNRGYIRDSEEAWVGEVIYLQHEACSGPSQRRRINISAVGHLESCHLSCDETLECPR